MLLHSDYVANWWLFKTHLYHVKLINNTNFACFKWLTIQFMLGIITTCFHSCADLVLIIARHIFCPKTYLHKKIRALLVESAQLKRENKWLRKKTFDTNIWTSRLIIIVMSLLLILILWKICFPHCHFPIVTINRSESGRERKP